jgi:hypothetical protein
LPFQIGDLPLGVGDLLFRIGDPLLGVGDLLFRIGDPLLGVGDLLVPFDYLLAEVLNLTLLLLDLPLQFFPAGRMRVRMPTRRYLLFACAPSGSRIHPPYDKRSRAECPADNRPIRPAE